MKKVAMKAGLLKPQSAQRINVNSRGCKPTDPASIIGPALTGPHNHPIATVGCHPSTLRRPAEDGRQFMSRRIAAAAIPNPKSAIEAPCHQHLATEISIPGSAFL